MGSNNGQSATLSAGNPVSNSNPTSIIVAGECLRLIEQRRSGELTSSEAIIQLSKLLPHDDRGKSALKRYINLCTKIDIEHAATSVHGGVKSKHRLHSACRIETLLECDSQKKVGEVTSKEFKTQTNSDDSLSFSHVK